MSYQQNQQQGQAKPGTSLTRMQLPSITTANAQEAFSNIQKFFPPEQYNTIMPVAQLTPANLEGMKPDVKVLDLSQHCYKQSGGMALGKSGLMQLADAYEIQLKTIEQVIERNYVRFTVEATMVRNGTTLLRRQGTKEIDIELEGEEILLDYKAKARETENHNRNWKANHGVDIPTYKPGDICYYYEKGNKWTNKGNWEDIAKREIIRLKKNKVPMCESKAMLRAIRNVLAIKGVYDEQEIQKPFVVFRLEPDWINMKPDQMRALQIAGQMSSAALTGSSAPPTTIDIPQPYSAPVSMAAHDFDEPEIIYEPEYDGVIDEDYQEAEQPIEVQAYQEVPPHNHPPTPAPQMQQQSPPHSHVTTETYQQQVRPPAQPLPPGPPPQVNVDPNVAGEIVAGCSSCNTGINQKVLTYSTGRFGAPLCWECQRAKGQR